MKINSSSNLSFLANVIFVGFSIWSIGELNNTKLFDFMPTASFAALILVSAFVLMINGWILIFKLASMNFLIIPAVHGISQIITPFVVNLDQIFLHVLSVLIWLSLFLGFQNLMRIRRRQYSEIMPLFILSITFLNWIIASIYHEYYLQVLIQASCGVVLSIFIRYHSSQPKRHEF